MKLGKQKDLLTVKDIAGRIALDRSDIGIERALRQVRHWTQCDLLRTLSQKNTGKGIPRFYEWQPTLMVAAILIELSRYGATVDMLRPVSEALYEYWEEDGMYLLTATTDYNSFLQVAWTTDATTGRFEGARFEFWDEVEEPDRRAFDAEPTSSIVINMTRLAERFH